ncbi:MAG: DUF4416 family protein [Pseudomonadota bacterium]
MGNPTYPKPVKLIASLIWRKEDSFHLALKKMVSLWGSLDFISEVMPFNYTDYYEKEMGQNLWRRMISFEPLINPERLSDLKHVTNEIETTFSSGPNKRTVNIDPGYISAHHLILATTKPCPHRPYLQNGIHADITLIYQEKSFRALPWTYPDYRSGKMIDLMNVLRQKYLFQLKRGRSEFNHIGISSV